MSMLTRWNPFKTGSSISLMPEFDDLLRFGGRSMLRDFEDVPDMRIDLSEDDRNYLVTVDIPGVNKEDITVSAIGNQVSIAAETRREVEHKDEKMLVSERRSGRSYRSFTLPIEVDEDKAAANYDNGVLHLTLPKKGNGGSHRIAIT